MGFPTGYETGRFLALDMGGTNLRVCEVELPEEKGEFDITQSKYRMPEELKTGSGEELWDYIASCLQQFVEYHHEGETLDQIPLGFTFSYPATQDYIDHGVLQRWTKGFDIDGVEGHDVVPPFENALKETVCIWCSIWVCLGCFGCVYMRLALKTTGPNERPEHRVPSCVISRTLMTNPTV